MRRVMAAAAVSLLGAWMVASAPAGPPTVVNDGHGDLVFVPAGAFKMGDNFGDGDPRERPVHVVELDAFYIGKYEMTNGEWRKFRDDPGYDDAKFWPGGWVVPKNQVPYWNDARNHGGGTPNSDEYPVLGVNWDSATAYCNWLSAKTGKKYRLPTEAEWEKAATFSPNAIQKQRFPWGDTMPDESRANLFENGLWVVAPIGAFPAGASDYGCQQLIGDVWEWTTSDYTPYPGFKSDFDEYNDKWFVGQKVLRGGSFATPQIHIRSTYRNFFYPHERWMIAGFRCTR